VDGEEGEGGGGREEGETEKKEGKGLGNELEGEEGKEVGERRRDELVELGLPVSIQSGVGLHVPRRTNREESRRVSEAFFERENEKCEARSR